MVSRVIGIDPGATGAMVVLDEYNIRIFNFKHTNSLTKRVSQITDQLDGTSPVYLEKVHAFPGQGVSATFTFGVNVGRIQGLLMSHHMAWKDVTPMMWQKELGLTGPYPTKALRKQAHLKKALELYPSQKGLIDIHNADAVLIAEYGYRKEKQKEEYNGI